MLNNKPRSCFIIGPMRDADLGDDARLIRLARQVIAPLLDEIERRDGVRYVVRTPYDLGGNHVMNDVIYAIDRADLVIADLTDSNPNVFYELGICHALGRACIAVMEDRQTKIEFDISAYRVYKLKLEDGRYLEAQQKLRDPINLAHRSISDWTKFENPVIDFFRAPITYISPAFALAQGYYLNFVKPVVESMIRTRGARYLYDVGAAALDKPQPKNIEDVSVLPDDVRRKLELHIVIPGRIALARHNFADRLRGRVPSALVEGDGRSYSCFYRAYDSDTRHALVDIPTTLRVMEDAVDRRMRYPNIHHDAPEWREVEDQEIQRFTLVLQMFIDRHDMNPEFAGRIRILRYNPDSPGDLLWLHAAVMNV